MLLCQDGANATTLPKLPKLSRLPLGTVFCETSKMRAKVLSRTAKTVKTAKPPCIYIYIYIYMCVCDSRHRARGHHQLQLIPGYCLALSLALMVRRERYHPRRYHPRLVQHTCMETQIFALGFYMLSSCFIESRSSDPVNVPRHPGVIRATFESEI